MEKDGLIYVSDDQPGYSRRRVGKGFAYYDEKGRLVRDATIRRRIEALAIPPAYVDVWICPSPRGHLQATGRDEKGRKQYRYHPAWRQQRDDFKFDILARFGESLPRIRKQVASDLASRSPDRDQVTAAVVRLLDQEHIRVGNDEYAAANNSFGATTLRNRHVDIGSRKVKLRFNGKRGNTVKREITDRDLKRVMKRCHDLPGKRLFSFMNDFGDVQELHSTDVNDYLRRVGGENFTAKQFRTWAASAIALDALKDTVANGDTVTIKSVVDPVAEALDNTPAISRASYIHPKVIALAKHAPDEEFFRDWPRKTKYLSRVERALLQLLQD